MGKNFMEAGTEIGDLVQQRNDILRKIANNVAAAVIDRAKNGKVVGLKMDINHLLIDLSDKEKYEVIVHVVELLAKNESSKPTHSNDDRNRRKSTGSDRSSLFGRFD